MRQIDISVHMDERLCLHAVGLNLSIRPMVWKAEILIIDHINLCIRQVQLVDEHFVPFLVGIESHLVIVLPQA